VAEPGLVVSPAVLGFDLWVMLAVSIACLPVFMTGHKMPRWEGALFLASGRDDVLRPFRMVMLERFTPLTVVVVVVALLTTKRPLRP
jgi:cation:H+ antiporter